MSDLPKHQLLLKLLRMTESDNDNEALIGLRKANTLLREAGWDWEKLLAGKIKVVGDPFASMTKPAGMTHARDPDPAPAAAPQQPRAPRPQAQPAYQPPRPTPPPPRGPTIGSTQSNQFGNHCYCCGTYVGPGTGWIFKQTPLSPKWEVACDPCNKSTAPLPSQRARKQKATLNNIMDSI